MPRKILATLATLAVVLLAAACLPTPTPAPAYTAPITTLR